MPLRNNQPHDNTGGIPFTDGGGTSIRWADFAAVAMGVLAGEFYTGLARFLASLLNAFIIDPVQGATEFAGDVVWQLTGVPGNYLTIAFGGTIRWIGQHPIVGFALGVVFVFGIAFVASRVMPRG